MDQKYAACFVIMALLSGLISSQTCNNALCKRRDIAGLEDDITGKMNFMENELEDKISEVRGDIFGVKDEVGKMATDISGVKDEVGKMATDLSGVKEEVVKLSGEISKLESEMKKQIVPEDNKSTFESSVMDHFAKIDSKLNMITADLPNKDCRLAKDGTSTILTSGKDVIANCDDGWLVIAHRFNGKEIFHNRTWNEYKNGFGSPQGEYFLGFEAILTILRRGKYKMRLDLVGWNNVHRIVEYSTFSIGEERDEYRITVNGFNAIGTSIFNSMGRHNNKPFSTIDRDNSGPCSCPKRYRGAWWFDNGLASNLFSAYPDGPKCDVNYGCMLWFVFPGSMYLKEMKMKIKPAT